MAVKQKPLVVRPELKNNMRPLREEKNISCAEIASHLGVCEMTVRRYERGMTVPLAQHLSGICAILETKVSDIFPWIGL